MVGYIIKCVTPAKAGVQVLCWIPAFAGMTFVPICTQYSNALDPRVRGDDTLTEYHPRLTHYAGLHLSGSISDGYDAVHLAHCVVSYRYT